MLDRSLDLARGLEQAALGDLRQMRRVVLLTAHLGGNADANWKARLNVRPVSGSDYEIVEQAYFQYDLTAPLVGQTRRRSTRIP